MCYGTNTDFDTKLLDLCLSSICILNLFPLNFQKEEIEHIWFMFMNGS